MASAGNQHESLADPASHGLVSLLLQEAIEPKDATTKYTTPITSFSRPTDRAATDGRRW